MSQYASAASLRNETRPGQDARAGTSFPQKETATIRSAAMMLEHMGLGAEGERLEAAVARVYLDSKVLTPDQGGTANTREMAQAVLAAYRNA